MRTVNVVRLGILGYEEAWNLQREVGERVLRGEIPETLLLLEHYPVYTVGRGAHGSLNNLLWDEERRAQEGIQLFQVDRGGDITYHGPGQLVGYPILNLQHYGRDLHQYLRQLEEAIIRTLQGYGLQAGRMPHHTGVWVGEDKVAAIGVKASQWITQHGFALNVDPNLAHFSGIVPCGISDKGVTSLAQLLDKPMTIAEVQPGVEESLAQVFDWHYENVSTRDFKNIFVG